MADLNPSEAETRLTSPNAPYALEQVSLNGFAIKQFKYGPKTLGEIYQKAGKGGRRLFVTAMAGSLTYEEVIHKSDLLAADLIRDHQIGVGTKIGLATDDELKWIIGFFAIVACGATAVLIDNHRSEILRHCLALTKCDLIISSDIRAKFLRDSGYSGPLHSPDQSEVKPGVGAKNDSGPGRLVAASVDSEALIAFTSGSTGTPKAAVLSHRSLTAGIMNMMLSGAMANARTKRDQSLKALAPCALVVGPPSYVGGYMQVLMTALLGGHLVMLAKWDAREAVNLIRTQKVTSIIGLNSDMAIEILRSENACETLETLRFWNVGGVALNQNICDMVKASLPHVVLGTGYGLTETSGGISSIAGQDLLDFPGSSGRLVPTVELKITDFAGNSVVSGSVGEISLRGPMVMKGYCSLNDGLTSIEDGWFYTGDVGYLGTDRQLYILDRRNDVLTFGGDVVSIGELEKILGAQPGVLEVCAFNAPDERGIPFLFIAILMTTDHDVTLNEIASALPSTLKKTSLWPKLFFVDEFPRTLSGKIDRMKLKEFARSSF